MKTIEDIKRHLMLHGSFTKDIGLLDGKMGIVIFFFNYSRFTNNTLYSDFAYDLIDEIYNDLSSDYSINFDNGLCGIGWGIEYLIANQFVNTDSSDILEDFDDIIMQRDIRKINDSSIETGVKGIAYYFVARYACKRQTKIPTEYLYELIHSLTEIPDKESLSLQSWLHEIIRCQKSEIPNLSFILKFAGSIPDALLSQIPLGIRNGLAGYGLTTINSFL